MDNPGLFLVIGLIAAGIALVLLFWGRSLQGWVNLLRKAVPISASDISDCLPGELVSLRGILHAADPLQGEYSQKPCIYYNASVTREYEVQRQRPNDTTRNDRRSEIISSNERSMPFEVRDDTGTVEVYPEGARFDAVEVVNRFEREGVIPGGTFAGTLSISLGSNSRTLGYRFKESIIPMGSEGFVLGVVAENGTITAPARKSPNTGLLVSYRSGDQLLKEWSRRAKYLAYGSIVLFPVGVISLLVAIAGYLF